MRYFNGPVQSDNRGIRFNQNLDEKSSIDAKTEAVKHLHAVFLLTAEKRPWCNGYWLTD